MGLRSNAMATEVKSCSVSQDLNLCWQTFVEINSFRNVWATNKSGQTKEYQPTDTAAPFPTATIVSSPDLAGAVTGTDQPHEQFFLFVLNEENP